MSLMRIEVYNNLIVGHHQLEFLIKKINLNNTPVSISTHVDDILNKKEEKSFSSPPILDSLQYRIQKAIDKLIESYKKPITLSEVYTLLKSTETFITIISTENGSEILKQVAQPISTLIRKILSHQWTFNSYQDRSFQLGNTPLTDAIIQTADRVIKNLGGKVTDPSYPGTILRFITCHCDQIKNLHTNWTNACKTKSSSIRHWITIRNSFFSYSRVVLHDIQRLYEKIEKQESRKIAENRITAIAPYLSFGPPITNTTTK